VLALNTESYRFPLIVNLPTYTFAVTPSSVPRSSQACSFVGA
jgi:hypothetical protein